MVERVGRPTWPPSIMTPQTSKSTQPQQNIDFSGCRRHQNLKIFGPRSPCFRCWSLHHIFPPSQNAAWEPTSRHCGASWCCQTRWLLRVVLGWNSVLDSNARVYACACRDQFMRCVCVNICTSTLLKKEWEAKVAILNRNRLIHTIN